MTRIDELVEIRPEVVHGDLHGIVSLYALLSDDDHAFEKDAARVLDATFPTRGLRRMFQRLHVSLGEEAGDRKGVFVISGGYGSGKSHMLLALYHVLTSPDIGRQWLTGSDIRFDPPDPVQVILLPMTQVELRDGSAVDYLWQPIFEALDYDGFEHTGNNFPTSRHLREAVGDRTVILIVDEVERWYGAISDEPQRNANLSFLQNLTEFCQDADNGLFLLLSLLLIEPQIRSIVERADHFVEDLTGAPDRHQFVLHRLVSSVDREGARPVVQRYLEAYKQLDAQVRIGDYNEYEQRMLASYPFHPETIDVVFDRYSSVARTEQTNYQNSRGAMYLLAHVFKQTVPSDSPEEGQLVDVDLIRLGDISLDITLLCDDLLNLNPAIVQIARSNHNASRKVEHATPVLSTILMHSLGEPSERHLGADFGELLLGALRPGDGDAAVNANQIQACLRQLEDTAVNLHIEENPTRWLFKEEVNIQTQINRRARAVPDEIAQAHIVQAVRDIMGDNDQLAVYPVEKVPDRRDIIFAISLHKLDRDEILQDIYRGRSYPNGLVVVDPRQPGRVDTDPDLLWMAKRIIAAKELEDHFVSEPRLRRRVRDIHDDMANALRQRIEDRYGNWQVPVQDPDSDQMAFRREQVRLDRTSILAAVENRYTEQHYESAVMQAVRDRGQTPPTVQDIRGDFYRQRSFPKPVAGRRASDRRIDNAIGQLVARGELQITRGDGKVTVYHDPGTLASDWVVAEAEGGPPPPKPEWIINFIGSNVRTVGEIRTECQRRGELQWGKQSHDTQIDSAIVDLVRQGAIEPTDDQASLDPPLSVDLQLRKPPTKRSWQTVLFTPRSKGALLTDVVQDIDKSDLIRNVQLHVFWTEQASDMTDHTRETVGLHSISPGEDTQVEVSYRVSDTPVNDRTDLQAIINALPDDTRLQVELRLERMKRDRS